MKGKWHGDRQTGGKEYEYMGFSFFLFFLPLSLSDFESTFIKAGDSETRKGNRSLGGVL